VKHESTKAGITDTLKSTGTAMKRQSRELGINSKLAAANKNITEFG